MTLGVRKTSRRKTNKGGTPDGKEWLTRRLSEDRPSQAGPLLPSTFRTCRLFRTDRSPDFSNSSWRPNSGRGLPPRGGSGWTPSDVSETWLRSIAAVRAMLLAPKKALTSTRQFVVSLLKPRNKLNQSPFFKSGFFRWFVFGCCLLASNRWTDAWLRTPDPF